MSTNSASLTKNSASLTKKSASLTKKSASLTKKSASLTKNSASKSKESHTNTIQTNNQIFHDIDKLVSRIVNCTTFHIDFFSIIKKNTSYIKTNAGFILYLELINKTITEFNAELCSNLTFAVLLFYYLYEVNIYDIRTNTVNLKKIINAFTNNSLLSRKGPNSYFLTIFYESGSSNNISYARFKADSSNLYNLLYEYYKIYKEYKYNITEFVKSLFISGFNGHKSVTNWIEPLLILLYKIKHEGIKYDYIDKVLKYPSLYENVKDINSIYDIIGYLRYRSSYMSQNLTTFWRQYKETFFNNTDRDERPNVIQIIDNIFKYINTHLKSNKANNVTKYKKIKADFITLLQSSITDINLNECEEVAENITNKELKTIFYTKINSIKSDMQSDKDYVNSVGNVCKKSEVINGCKINGEDMGPICEETLIDYGIDKTQCK